MYKPILDEKLGRVSNSLNFLGGIEPDVSASITVGISIINNNNNNNNNDNNNNNENSMQDYCRLLTVIKIKGTAIKRIFSYLIAK